MKEIGLILFCTIMCLFFAACTKESNFQKGTHVDNKSSEQLYVEAGDYYLGLNGKEKNYKKAFSLLMQSAELGHSKAQTEVARMYYDGVGVNQNYEKAFYWFEKAAKKNDEIGLYNLGVMYKEGKYVKQDDVQALKYFEESSKKELSEAQFTLGRLCCTKIS
ncbi:sel1 repeat family protein (plasmid) [Acinetobacter sp. YH12138]|uniref:tetratricopeptide repeat protein n=1 Tax=unclassified Acinetobacter TaxID=196816 RepID=UPI0015D0F37B|nr:MULTISPECIES: tetratricopeptide repeat protein [unclassified Acinetobacter]QOW51434.1 sel1 repeat family protein [Acinetobacter sp. YH12138]